MNTHLTALNIALKSIRRHDGEPFIPEAEEVLQVDDPLIYSHTPSSQTIK